MRAPRTLSRSRCSHRHMLHDLQRHGQRERDTDTHETDMGLTCNGTDVDDMSGLACLEVYGRAPSLHLLG